MARTLPPRAYLDTQAGMSVFSSLITCRQAGERAGTGRGEEGHEKGRVEWGGAGVGGDSI